MGDKNIQTARSLILRLGLGAMDAETAEAMNAMHMTDIKEKQEETVNLLVTEQPVPYKFCHFSAELFSELYSNTARALPKTQIRDTQHGPHTQFTYVCTFNFLY